MNKIKYLLKKIPILKLLISEAYELLENFIVKYPNTKFGLWMRKNYWSSKCKIGSNAFICQGVIVHASKRELVDIGESVQMGNNTTLNIGQCKGLYVGDYVSMAIGTFIRSGNHKFDRQDVPIQKQGHDCKTIAFNDTEYSIVIEDDCWIGAHCILLSGTHLGKGTVLAAGTVVSSIVPAYSIVAGNPARVIGKR